MKQIQLGGHNKNSTIRGYTTVDDADFEFLNQWKWNTNGNYAKTNAGNGKSTYMHHLILQVSKGMNVDHINGDRLDNRRSNLRVSTVSQNAANRDKQSNNTSGFKGVFWNKRDNRWLAQIRVESKQIYLGQYINKIDAATTYNVAATKYFGEYGRINQL